MTCVAHTLMILLAVTLLHKSLCESQPNVSLWSEQLNARKAVHDAKRWFVPSEEASFEIDAGHSVESVSRFWTSTGFCGPDPHQEVSDWLLMPSMMQNVALIGAIPFEGIHQVRVHWLLDAIRVSSVVDGAPIYNFTSLDSFVGVLWDNGLVPGFEVMGNPSNYFTNFEDDTQMALWADLVFQLARRYIDQFGIGYMSKWNFESWNEPRKLAFDGLNVTLKGFLKYYDASSAGLLKASPRLLLGGPGGACPDLLDPTSYCWALLDHVQNGLNHFTGRMDVKLDFISIHKKGAVRWAESFVFAQILNNFASEVQIPGKPPSNTKAILDEETEFISQLQQHLPLLATNVSLYNDEADPLVSWHISRDWQADVTYAAMIAKIIVEHQNLRSSWQRAGVDFRLLSNDNGFLSYMPYPFTQRTQLARFQVNTTHPPHVQFVRKPAYVVMGLLGLLGELQLDARQPSYKCNYVFDAEPCRLGVLPTVHLPTPGNQHDSWQLTVLLYNSNDTGTSAGPAGVALVLNNVPDVDLFEIMFVLYYMDNNATNPYKAWMSAGSPQTPDWKTFKLMRSYEEPVRLLGPVRWTLTRGQPLRVILSDPSVSLLHLCSRPDKPPDQVTNLVVYNVTFSQVQIVWSDSCVGTRCLKTYEVEYAPDSIKASFVRVNDVDTIFNSYFFAPNNGNMKETTRGFYRVRAVDYWGRPGEYSLLVQYP